jgi:hypothetical protein
MKMYYVEKMGPIVLGIAALSTWMFWEQALSKWIVGDAKDIYAAVITISSIFVAFIATIKTILASAGELRSIKLLKTSSAHYRQFLSYLFEGILSNFLLAVLSLSLLVANFRGPGLAFSIWVGILVWGLVATLRVVAVFHRILTSRI